MLKKSPFFDFLNRREDTDFHQYLANSIENADFLDFCALLATRKLGDSLFIRDCYVRLYDLIVSQMQSNRHKFAVSGTPGIDW